MEQIYREEFPHGSYSVYGEYGVNGDSNKKPNYVKEPTRDFSNLKKIVNPDLKKRNDELFKALVGSLNKKTSL